MSGQSPPCGGDGHEVTVPHKGGGIALHNGSTKTAAVPRGCLKRSARSATFWASGRTRDPYFEILGAPRGIMVTPSGGFDF